MGTSVEEFHKSARAICIIVAPTDSHLYLFVDVANKVFGTKCLALYIEFYLRAMTPDINYLDHVRGSENQNEAYKIETHIATVFDNLSTLFMDSHRVVARECMFSAFILNPTIERLHTLQKFSDNISKNAKQIKSKITRKSKPEINDVCRIKCLGRSKTRQYNYNPMLDVSIDGISKELMEDFINILETFRPLLLQYNDFNWKSDYNKLEKHLKLYNLKNQTVIHEKLSDGVLPTNPSVQKPIIMQHSYDNQMINNENNTVIDEGSFSTVAKNLKDPSSKRSISVKPFKKTRKGTRRSTRILNKERNQSEPSQFSKTGTEIINSSIECQNNIQAHAKEMSNTISPLSSSLVGKNYHDNPHNKISAKKPNAVQHMHHEKSPILSVSVAEKSNTADDNPPTNPSVQKPIIMQHSYDKQVTANENNTVINEGSFSTVSKNLQDSSSKRLISVVPFTKTRKGIRRSKRGRRKQGTLSGHSQFSKMGTKIINSNIECHNNILAHSKETCNEISPLSSTLVGKNYHDNPHNKISAKKPNAVQHMHLEKSPILSVSVAEKSSINSNLNSPTSFSKLDRNTVDVNTEINILNEKPTTHSNKKSTIFSVPATLSDKNIDTDSILMEKFSIIQNVNDKALNFAHAKSISPASSILVRNTADDNPPTNPSIQKPIIMQHSYDNQVTANENNTVIDEGSFSTISKNLQDPSSKRLISVVPFTKTRKGIRRSKRGRRKQGTLSGHSHFSKMGTKIINSNIECQNNILAHSKETCNAISPLSSTLVGKNYHDNPHNKISAKKPNAVQHMHLEKSPILSVSVAEKSSINSNLNSPTSFSKLDRNTVDVNTEINILNEKPTTHSNKKSTIYSVPATLSDKNIDTDSILMEKSSIIQNVNDKALNFAHAKSISPASSILVRNTADDNPPTNPSVQKRIIMQHSYDNQVTANKNNTVIDEGSFSTVSKNLQDPSSKRLISVVPFTKTRKGIRRSKRGRRKQGTLSGHSQFSKMGTKIINSNIECQNNILAHSKETCNAISPLSSTLVAKNYHDNPHNKISAKKPNAVQHMHLEKSPILSVSVAEKSSINSNLNSPTSFSKLDRNTVDVNTEINILNEKPTTHSNKKSTIFSVPATLSDKNIDTDSILMEKFSIIQNVNDKALNFAHAKSISPASSILVRNTADDNPPTNPSIQKPIIMQHSYDNQVTANENNTVIDEGSFSTISKNLQDPSSKRLISVVPFTKTRKGIRRSKRGRRKQGTLSGHSHFSKMGTKIINSNIECQNNILAHSKETCNAISPLSSTLVGKNYHDNPHNKISAKKPNAVQHMHLEKSPILSVSVAEKSSINSNLNSPTSFSKLDRNTVDVNTEINILNEKPTTHSNKKSTIYSVPATLSDKNIDTDSILMEKSSIIQNVNDKALNFAHAKSISPASSILVRNTADDNPPTNPSVQKRIIMQHSYDNQVTANKNNTVIDEGSFSTVSKNLQDPSSKRLISVVPFTKTRKGIRRSKRGRRKQGTLSEHSQFSKMGTKIINSNIECQNNILAHSKETCNAISPLSSTLVAKNYHDNPHNKISAKKPNAVQHMHLEKSPILSVSVAEKSSINSNLNSPTSFSKLDRNTVDVNTEINILNEKPTTHSNKKSTIYSVPATLSDKNIDTDSILMEKSSIIQNVNDKALNFAHAKSISPASSILVRNTADDNPPTNPSVQKRIIMQHSYDNQVTANKNNTVIDEGSFSTVSKNLQDPSSKRLISVVPFTKTRIGIRRSKRGRRKQGTLSEHSQFSKMGTKIINSNIECQNNILAHSKETCNAISPLSSTLVAKNYHDNPHNKILAKKPNAVQHMHLEKSPILSVSVAEKSLTNSNLNSPTSFSKLDRNIVDVNTQIDILVEKPMIHSNKKSTIYSVSATLADKNVDTDSILMEKSSIIQHVHDKALNFAHAKSISTDSSILLRNTADDKPPSNPSVEKPVIMQHTYENQMATNEKSPISSALSAFAIECVDVNLQDNTSVKSHNIKQHNFEKSSTNSNEKSNVNSSELVNNTVDVNTSINIVIENPNNTQKVLEKPTVGSNKKSSTFLASSTHEDENSYVYSPKETQKSSFIQVIHDTSPSFPQEKSISKDCLTFVKNAADDNPKINNPLVEKPNIMQHTYDNPMITNEKPTISSYFTTFATECGDVNFQNNTSVESHNIRQHNFEKCSKNINEKSKATLSELARNTVSVDTSINILLEKPMIYSNEKSALYPVSATVADKNIKSPTLKEKSSIFEYVHDNALTFAEAKSISTTSSTRVRNTADDNSMTMNEKSAISLGNTAHDIPPINPSVEEPIIMQYTCDNQMATNKNSAVSSVVSTFATECVDVNLQNNALVESLNIRQHNFEISSKNSNEKVNAILAEHSYASNTVDVDTSINILVEKTNVMQCVLKKPTTYTSKKSAIFSDSSMHADKNIDLDSGKLTEMSSCRQPVHEKGLNFATEKSIFTVSSTLIKNATDDNSLINTSVEMPTVMPHAYEDPMTTNEKSELSSALVINSFYVNPPISISVEKSNTLQLTRAISITTLNEVPDQNLSETIEKRTKENQSEVYHTAHKKGTLMTIPQHSIKKTSKSGSRLTSSDMLAPTSKRNIQGLTKDDVTCDGQLSTKHVNHTNISSNITSCKKVCLTPTCKSVSCNGSAQIPTSQLSILESSMSLSQLTSNDMLASSTERIMQGQTNAALTCDRQRSMQKATKRTNLTDIHSTLSSSKKVCLTPCTFKKENAQTPKPQQSIEKNLIFGSQLTRDLLDSSSERIIQEKTNDAFTCDYQQSNMTETVISINEPNKKPFTSLNEAMVSYTNEPKTITDSKESKFYLSPHDEIIAKSDLANGTYKHKCENVNQPPSIQSSSMSNETIPCNFSLLLGNSTISQFDEHANLSNVNSINVPSVEKVCPSLYVRPTASCKETMQMPQLQQSTQDSSISESQSASSNLLYSVNQNKKRPANEVVTSVALQSNMVDAITSINQATKKFKNTFKNILVSFDVRELENKSEIVLNVKEESFTTLDHSIFGNLIFNRAPQRPNHQQNIQSSVVKKDIIKIPCIISPLQGNNKKLIFTKINFTNTSSTRALSINEVHSMPQSINTTLCSDATQIPELQQTIQKTSGSQLISNDLLLLNNQEEQRPTNDTVTFDGLYSNVTDPITSIIPPTNELTTKLKKILVSFGASEIKHLIDSNKSEFFLYVKDEKFTTLNHSIFGNLIINSNPKNGNQPLSVLSGVVKSDIIKIPCIVSPLPGNNKVLLFTKINFTSISCSMTSSVN